MAMTRFALLFFLLCAGLFNSSSGQGLFKKGDITLRFHPLGFLDADAGLQAGMGYRFAKRLSVTGELGYLFLDPMDRLGYREYLRGWKWRQELRYHYDYFWWFPRAYHALELFYKNVSYHKQATVGFNCIQGNCAYYMLADIREVKSEFGIAIKGGIEIPLSAKGDPWSLEMYSGFGFKFIQYKEKGIPEGSMLISGFGRELLPWEAELEGTPYIPSGVKIVYKLPVR